MARRRWGLPPLLLLARALLAGSHSCCLLIQLSHDQHEMRLLRLAVIVLATVARAQDIPVSFMHGGAGGGWRSFVISGNQPDRAKQSAKPHCPAHCQSPLATRCPPASSSGPGECVGRGGGPGAAPPGQVVAAATHRHRAAAATVPLALLPSHMCCEPPVSGPSQFTISRNCHALLAG